MVLVLSYLLRPILFYKQIYFESGCLYAARNCCVYSLCGAGEGVGYQGRPVGLTIVVVKACSATT